MALPNDFKVLTWIANKALAQLVTKLPYLMISNRDYSPEFDNTIYAKGDTIQIRRSNRRIGGEGATVNLDGIIEKTEILKIENQFNDAIPFTTKELALFTTGKEGQQLFFERYIVPSINIIAHKLHRYIAERAAIDLVYSTGTPGTPINSASYVSDTYALMQDLMMPVENDKFLVVTPKDGSQLKSSLVNYYNPTFHKGIGEIYFLKQIEDFFFHSTPHIMRHIAGAASDNVTYPALTIKADVTSGNTIVVTGFGGPVTGAFKKGDIITVEDSNIVVPNPARETNLLAQFTVQEDANAIGGGDATITVSPEIIIDPTNPWQNLSDKLAIGSKVVCKKDHNVNTALCKGGLTLVCPKMAPMYQPESNSMAATAVNKDYGISIRVSKGGDIINDKNILRFDLLCGAKWHSEYGVKALS